MMSEKEKELTLEEALIQLEQMTGTMDEEELPLEESFALYQKGIELVRFCQEKIDQVEKKLIVLQSER